MKNLLILVLSVALVGTIAAFIHLSKSCENMLKISEESQTAYLNDRFNGAYSSQPANVAIWEGTNLVASLDENWIPPLSLDKCARLSFIHARLCALFKESGMSNAMVLEADQARKWVQAISTNTAALSSDEVVSNLLNKDSIQRQFNSTR